MLLKFKQIEGVSVSSLKPGEWTWWLHGGWKGEPQRKMAAVCCPGCHHLFCLANHTIKDSSVSPSVVCPHKGCSFHQFVQLELP